MWHEGVRDGRAQASSARGVVALLGRGLRGQPVKPPSHLGDEEGARRTGRN